MTVFKINGLSAIVETVDIEFEGEADSESVGKFVGYIYMTLRQALGDFVLADSAYLAPAENYLFWALFILLILIGNIIFLNFVIAEATKSYDEVDERIEATQMMEKSMLCAEAEEMMPNSFKE